MKENIESLNASGISRTGRPKKAPGKKFKRIAITIEPELLIKITALLEQIELCRTEYFISLVKADLNKRGE